MSGARNVGVRQFIHQHHFRFPRQDRVHVHLREERALVINHAPRNGFQLRRKFRDALSPVRFHHPDHHVFAAAVPPYGLAQHAERLAPARRVSQKKLQRAFFFFGGLRRGQPLLGSFWHACILFYGRCESYVRMAVCACTGSLDSCEFWPLSFWCWEFPLCTGTFFSSIPPPLRSLFCSPF